MPIFIVWALILYQILWETSWINRSLKEITMAQELAAGLLGLWLLFCKLFPGKEMADVCFSRVFGGPAHLAFAHGRFELA
jgi:hypothetical protein